MTRHQVQSYWNERIRLEQAENVRWAGYHLNRLRASVKRRLNREHKKRQLVLFGDKPKPQSDMAIMIKVGRKKLSFLYRLEEMIAFKRNYLEEVLAKMEPGKDYPELDFLWSKGLGIEYFNEKLGIK